MDELTQEQENKAQKLLVLQEDPALAVFNELESIGEKLNVINSKETPTPPEVQKIEINGISVVTLKGDPGEKGDTGEKGDSGNDGTNGNDGKDGKSGKDGRDGRDGRDGVDGNNGENGKDGSPDTPDQTVDKVNASNKLIQKDRIEGLADIERIARNNQAGVPVTTNFFNGLRAKNLNIANSTATQSGDTVTITVTSSGGSGYQSPTGTVDGANKDFAFATAPNALVVDGVSMRKTASDGTVNWTGTTSITLSVAPNFDVFAVA